MKITRTARLEFGEQLPAFLESVRNFNAACNWLSGVPVATVNPRNTSRTCPRCGHISKRNRPTRDLFKCVGCGLAGPADHIAAENIGRAAGNRPYAVAAQC